MTNEGSPAMLRQQQLVEAIATKAAAAAPAGWTHLVLRAVVVGREAHYELRVTTPDGASEWIDPGIGFHRDVKQLRELTLRDGVGPWFTMTLTLDEIGSADLRFDYDGEPQLDFELTDGAFKLDTERFPRDPEHMPEWLRRRLTE